MTPRARQAAGAGKPRRAKRTPQRSVAGDPDPTEVRGLRGPLLRWYRRHRRDLPWRRTRDPYAIWVAEVMLQQTQVATVLPYYARFLERFPDAASLARAGAEQVLALWSGLGYYRRARALHEGARVVVREYGGRLPADAERLRRLPGIGRYTAGAIASIGFDRREPVLDGNVRRVLSRLFAVGGPATRGGTDPLLWRIATVLADGPRPGDLNQALMELGALVCVPQAPRCAACPVAGACRARREGRPEAYPPPRPSRPTERQRVAVALVRRAGKVLLERPDGSSPLRGSWDLPATAVDDGSDARARLREGLERRHALRLVPGELAATARHGILHRRLALEVYACRHRGGRVAGRHAVRWASLSELDEVPVSGATRKILARVTAD